MPITDTWLRKNSVKTHTKEIVKADRDGLYVRARGNKISFLYRPYFNKKQITMTIGSYPAMSLKQARALVLEYDALIFQGIDPRSYVKMKKLENIEAATVDKVVYRWIDDVCKVRNKEWGDIQRSYELHVQKEFGKQAAESVSLVGWRNLFYKIGKKYPQIAGRCATIIKASLKHAISSGVIKGPNVLGETQRRDFILPTAKKQARVLSLDEINTIFGLLKTNNFNLRDRCVVLLLLLYGCRGRELRLTKRAWLSADKWELPSQAHKVGGSSLVRPILPEFKHLWDMALECSTNPEYVFTNYLNQTDCSGFFMSRSAVRNIIRHLLRVSHIEGSAIANFSTHDLRKTARTYWVGDYVTCEKMLGHTVSSVADIYDRRDWSDHMIPIYRQWWQTLLSLDNGSVLDPIFPHQQQSSDRR